MRIHVAYQASLTRVYTVHTDINNNCARLNEVVRDQLGPANRGYQNVRAPALGRKIGSSGMAAPSFRGSDAP